MNQKRKTILFVLPSLEGGGSQRVMLTIMRYMDRDKFACKLALVKKEGEFLSQIPKDIEIFDLKSKQLRYAIYKLIKLIRSKKPDILFSTLGHLNLLICILKPFFPKKTLFVARESNTVSIQNRSEKYPLLFDWLYKNIYKNFDLIIAQSNFMKKDLTQNYKIVDKKIKVIYNPLALDKTEKIFCENRPECFDKSKINLLSIGRIEHQKGYDLLIDAMSRLDDRFVVTILGEGSLKKELQSSLKQKALEKRVYFKGFSQNPYLYMRYADLLILPSRYEGFANVVLEANGCKLPVVAFEAPGVDKEIIQNGFNGFLVKRFDPKELSKTIKKALKHDFDKNAIQEHTKKRYDPRVIVKEYEDAVIKAYKNKIL